MPEEFMPGSVWLVGAGPGDPDLLTRKAERLLAPQAELVGVGKRSGRHSKDQGTIDQLIVAAALAGRRVLRLKGGDPSIFGRAAEELTACSAHGVPVHICPGITAASAAAASGLASLTLRGEARQLTFLTAHVRGNEPLDLDWARLGSSDATLAIYMGRAAAPEIARNLIAAGRDPATPVMVAVNVSRPDERLLRGRLDALSFLVRTIGQDDPTLLLIGEAVAAQSMSMKAGLSHSSAAPSRTMTIRAANPSRSAKAAP
jgi:uroporphyrin-III C-methyltransferase